MTWWDDLIQPSPSQHCPLAPHHINSHNDLGETPHQVKSIQPQTLEQVQSDAAPRQLSILFLLLTCFNITPNRKSFSRLDYKKPQFAEIVQIATALWAASASAAKYSSWSHQKKKKSQTTHVSIFPDNVTCCARSSDTCLSNYLITGEFPTSESKTRSHFIKWVPICSLNILRTRQIKRLEIIYAA